MPGPFRRIQVASPHPNISPLCPLPLSQTYFHDLVPFLFGWPHFCHLVCSFVPLNAYVGFAPPHSDNVFSL